MKLMSSKAGINTVPHHGLYVSYQGIVCILRAKKIGVVLDILLVTLPINQLQSVIYDTNKKYLFDLSELNNLRLPADSISLSQKFPKHFADAEDGLSRSVSSKWRCQNSA